MPEYRFVQFDVFTDRAFGGNPLAVFPEAEGISDEHMMQIAREMNLSETVFVLRPEGQTSTTQADAIATQEPLRKLRIFTPMREIRLLGIRSSAPGPHSRKKTWYQCPKVATVGNAFITKSALESCRSISNSEMVIRSRSR